MNEHFCRENISLNTCLFESNILPKLMQKANKIIQTPDRRRSDRSWEHASNIADIFLPSEVLFCLPLS